MPLMLYITQLGNKENEYESCTQNLYTQYTFCKYPDWMNGFDIEIRN